MVECGDGDVLVRLLQLVLLPRKIMILMGARPEPEIRNAREQQRGRGSLDSTANGHRCDVTDLWFHSKTAASIRAVEITRLPDTLRRQSTLDSACLGTESNR